MIEQSSDHTSSRRNFILRTGRFAAASALAGVTLPHVYAAENNTIQIALIGCGGRGTGAAGQALSVKNGPTKLVAMADVFPDKLRRSVEDLKGGFRAQVDVPKERQFLGLDAYQKAMDCLKPGDVAIFATPPAFRWVHFTYAIQKSLHVFMEKPVTVDGPTSRRMFQLGEESVKKNLKVGVGLMVRHCRGRQEMHERIRQGEIGELISMRAYRTGGRAAVAGLAPTGTSELMHQIRRFHSFLWSGGGLFSDYNIHQIDECCWMKNAWPIQAHGVGGRHFRGDALDQNFDSYGVEFVFPDGTRMWFTGRHISGCHEEFASYVHGTKGSGIVSTSSHTPGKVRLFKGHNIKREDLIWAFPQPEPNPYQTEWDDLIDAIRADKPYNEVERGVKASLVTSMGRMAAHTGQIVTYDDILNSDHEFAPGLDKLTADSPAPLRAGPDGKYPVPMPGQNKRREY